MVAAQLGVELAMEMMTSGWVLLSLVLPSVADKIILLYSQKNLDPEP